MLIGRLGLDEARIRHADRHGLIWLDRGSLTVEAGCLRFVTAGGELPPGDYQIPQQALSMILLGPGSSLTHDVLRLAARHGTAIAAVGDGGVRFYTAPPLGPDRSDIARRQALCWANDEKRIHVARRMYAWRLGEITPKRTLEALRGIEGAHVKESYRLVAERFGVPWHGRIYDRKNPQAADLANQALNHMSSATQAAASIAVASLSALPQLGFIHEDSDQSFVLDIADLFREEITLPVAFAAAKEAGLKQESVDRIVRRKAAIAFKKNSVISEMIDRITSLFSTTG